MRRWSVDRVFIYVIATISIVTVVVGLLCTVARGVKGVFDLGRKTAKLNPWRKSTDREGLP